jgi:hypothetical protein
MDKVCDTMLIKFYLPILDWLQGSSECESRQTHSALGFSSYCKFYFRRINAMHVHKTFCRRFLAEHYTNVFILISVAADDIKSCDEFLKFTV